MFAHKALLGIMLAGLSVPALLAQESRPEATAERDVKALIAELGADSYKVRLQAEKELLAMGEKVLPALKEAAKDESDPEVQWRARRLVRQIQAGEEGGLRSRDARERPVAPRGGAGSSPLGTGELDEVFDRMFRQLERDFGMDIPRRHFFQDDFFQDLQQQMQDMRQQVRDSQSQSMSMKMGPDGVRVEIKSKNAEGEEEVKVYEAPDLETFKQKYPGVLEGQGLNGGGFGFRMGLPRDLFGRRPDLLEPPVAVPPPAPQPYGIVPPEGERLGVLVREDPGSDAGLQVEEVQPDSLAERLELRAGDVVVKIGEVGIRRVEDVQKALRGIDAGEKVRVEVQRDGEKLVLEAEKQVAPRTRKLRAR